MTTEHAAVFHCLECGRIVYLPRGAQTPDCCGRPMVCAIADLIREAEESTANCEYATSLIAPPSPSERFGS